MEVSQDIHFVEPISEGLTVEAKILHRITSAVEKWLVITNNGKLFSSVLYFSDIGLFCQTLSQR